MSPGLSAFLQRWAVRSQKGGSAMDEKIIRVLDCLGKIAAIIAVLSEAGKKVVAITNA